MFRSAVGRVEWNVTGQVHQTNPTFLELILKTFFIELFFRQQAMTVVFGYGKLLQAVFGSQLEVWVWSKRKK